MKKTRSYELVKLDPMLKPYEGDINMRMDRYNSVRNALLSGGNDISSFANGHLYFGFHRTEDGWVFREWAPAADEVHLIGDFNDWNGCSHPLNRISANGIWEIYLNGKHALSHGQRVKLRIRRGQDVFDWIPTYIHKVVQDGPNASYNGVIYAPEAEFSWTDAAFMKRRKPSPLIYEAHVGMAQEHGHIGTYDEFTDYTLPRIKKDGYNTVQLMAVMEHPYYASFGYQVSSFFAPSSRYGEPEALKRLINTAHSMGISVLLDIVHSHMCANALDGIALFDGTQTQFCHMGDRGRHPAWGTYLFDYAKHDVIHFLLSNIKYWQDEFHFDGFRFDGVTSMLYLDHGLGTAFDDYKKYYSMNTDIDAIIYLQLANELIHSVNKKAISIAEDMSGMPGMCLPIKKGGIGFDYRLSMGLPDYWIKAIKNNNWNLYDMWWEMTTRRPGEKAVGYSESHDQALVGDKTLIFRLADAEMYYGMNNDYHTYTIDKAIGLSKLIKFMTLTSACDGYLNFMGNEFGHPEWIDFPREGNGNSFHYARRQWHLADDVHLKYSGLLAFDNDMLAFAKKYDVLSTREARSLWVEPFKLVIACEKQGLVYLYSFNMTNETIHFFVPIGEAGDRYRPVFTSALIKYADGRDAYDMDKTEEVILNDGKTPGFWFDINPFTVIVFEKV